MDIYHLFASLVVASELYGIFKLLIEITKLFEMNLRQYIKRIAKEAIWEVLEGTNS